MQPAYRVGREASATQPRRREQVLSEMIIMIMIMIINIMIMRMASMMIRE